jgi:hypothetical protein
MLSPLGLGTERYAAAGEDTAGGDCELDTCKKLQ